MKGESTFGTAVKISTMKPEVGELRRERSGKSAVKITRRRLNVEVGTGQATSRVLDDEAGKSELVRSRDGNLLWFYDDEAGS